MSEAIYPALFTIGGIMALFAVVGLCACFMPESKKSTGQDGP